MNGFLNLKNYEFNNFSFLKDDFEDFSKVKILEDNNLKLLNNQEFEIKNIYELLSYFIYFTTEYKNIIYNKVLEEKNKLILENKNIKYNDIKLKNLEEVKDINIVLELFSLAFNYKVNIIKVNGIKKNINLLFFGNNFQKEINIFNDNNTFKILMEIDLVNNYNEVNNWLNDKLNQIETHINAYNKLNNITFKKKKEQRSLIDILNSKNSSPIRKSLNEKISIDMINLNSNKSIKINSQNNSNKKIKKKVNYNIPLIKDPIITYNNPQEFMLGERNSGWLKFYDEKKQFGFIVNEDNGKDIFVHFDDLIKIKNNKGNILNLIKNKYLLKFSFNSFFYKGKYNDSKKAVNIKLIEIKPPINN